ncbi:MAG: N-6 DNA methylase [Clostridium sp.]
MIKDFLKDIKLIYKNIDKIDRNTINEFREKWSIEGTIGHTYESIVQKQDRKSSGSFYTPYSVTSYMNNKILYNFNLDNINVKILDPSCGGGYFLIDMYIKLEEKLRGKLENHKKHIIENMIYGFDIDKTAVYITVIELFYLSGYVCKNIKNKDYLKISNRNKFDLIIGNPPYIGHKVLDKEYSKCLKESFNEVFYNKGDISFCFIKKSIDLLSENGKIGFFTSRYLIESLCGDGIRNYIINNASIDRIIDFYGVRILKGVGVDNIIMFLSKNPTGSIEYFKLKECGKDMGDKVFDDIDLKEEKLSSYIKVDAIDIKGKPWSFYSSTEKEIINKIHEKCNIKLCDIAFAFQGIITGSDKAFIVNNNDSINVEEKLLKPWLKGKQVNRFYTDIPLKKIIYTDIIDNIESYPHAKEFLMPYKEKLEIRRECIRGIRHWYNIQWGRKSEYFEGTKIIFPYKSPNNRFTIDRGNYFSADIYGLRLSSSEYSYEFLTCILNSSIYEFYIKTIAKKLGDSLYEYYPNKIINIPIVPFIKSIENLYKGKDTDDREIDRLLLDYFELSNEQYLFIRQYIGCTGY